MKRRVLALVAFAAAFGCQDPVHDEEVAALGPEAPGVAPSALHRAGQPCLVCHGGDGPARGTLTFGGTIYETQTGPLAPLVGALVTMTDANGASFHGVTNAAGNFYVPASAGAPAFPATVSLAYDANGTTAKQSMSTFVGRDGSCATCHADPAGPNGPGHVWLAADPGALPAGTP